MTKKKKVARKKKAKVRRKVLGNRPGITTAAKRQMASDPEGITQLQRLFLEAFVATTYVSHAAEAVGIKDMVHYDWKRGAMNGEAYTKAYELREELVEQKREQRVLANIQKVGNPDEGFTEVTTVEEIEPVLVTVPTAQCGSHPLGERCDTCETKTEMRVKKAKRTSVKKFSITAMIWEGNRKLGNPARMEVTGKDGGPIKTEQKVTLDVLRAIALGPKDKKGEDDGADG